MDELFRVADTETRLRHVVEAGVVVVAAFAVGIAVSLGGLLVLDQLGFTRTGDFAVIFVTTAALQFVGFYLVVGWYFAGVRAFDELVHLRTPRLVDVGWTIAGLFGLFAVFAVVAEILAQLGTQPAPNQIVDVGSRDPVIFLYLVPVTILFVAPAEELVFRGVVQGSLRRAYGVLPGVVLGGAVFGVVHVVALGSGGSVAGTVLSIVALGVLLGTVYELSETILVPIAVHALWNTIAFLANYAGATGGLG